MWNQTEWHTPELQLRYGERTGAEELGLMCCRYLALGGDAHVLRRSLASTRQVILSSGYALRRSTTLSCENKQSASLSTAVNGVAFNFTDSRASSQTWSAMAHWLFTTERVRMNE